LAVPGATSEAGRGRAGGLPASREAPGTATGKEPLTLIKYEGIHDYFFRRRLPAAPESARIHLFRKGLAN
jgi:hypothetical protein